MRRHPLLLLIAGLALVLGILVFAVLTKPAQDSVEWKQVGSNNETDNTNTKPTNQNTAPTNTNEATHSPIPASAKLEVPFTSQAPNGDWSPPYNEACEEASVLMAGRFFQDRPIKDAADADTAILQLTEYVDTEMGLPIDMTAAETAQLVERFYELQTEVLYEFTWDDIKQAIANGYPVLVPAAGKQLGNPNFTPPGPPYHMLVIIGYTPDTVITNDPGTRNGAGYEYDYDTFYNAIHDWNDGDVENGQKAIIIVKPTK